LLKSLICFCFCFCFFFFSFFELLICFPFRRYHDLPGVREGIVESGVPREQVFITCKVDDPFGYDETMSNIKQILQVLNTTYVDMVLMHWPAPMAWDFTTTTFNTTAVYTQSCGTPAQCRVSTVRALNDAVKAGLIRLAGVANFELRHLQDLIDAGVDLPAVNQIEYHPYWHEDDLVEKLFEMGISVQSYSPLGAPDYMAVVPNKWSVLPLDLPHVREIASEVNKTAAQVLIRWQLQKGLTVNPRTLNPAHMAENLNTFDFVLSQEQMLRIDQTVPPRWLCKVCLLFFF
jgi:diketogulonate reductase-like aldo/keto reductase